MNPLNDMKRILLVSEVVRDLSKQSREVVFLKTKLVVVELCWAVCPGLYPRTKLLSDPLDSHRNVIFLICCCFSRLISKVLGEAAFTKAFLLYICKAGVRG